jgi:thiol-disulfide isomerase/thioredoxin
MTKNENHRAEVLYDVLLPWVVGEGVDSLDALPPTTTTTTTTTYSSSSSSSSSSATAAAAAVAPASSPPRGTLLLTRAMLASAQDRHAEWRTPARSGTSTFGSAVEALRYALACSGVSPPLLKQFSYALRDRFLRKATSQLLGLARQSLERDQERAADSARDSAEGVAPLTAAAAASASSSASSSGSNSTAVNSASSASGDERAPIRGDTPLGAAVLEAMEHAQLEPEDPPAAPTEEEGGEGSTSVGGDLGAVLDLLRSGSDASQLRVYDKARRLVPRASLPADTVVALYFSASWCGPCRSFTPRLVQMYTILRSIGHRFEVVFVSNDRAQQGFEQYWAEMPWLAVPFEDSRRRQQLGQLFGVRGIPTLVLFGADGRLITKEGVELVSKDPRGEQYPWRAPGGQAEAEPEDNTDENGDPLPPELPPRIGLSPVDRRLLRIACEQFALNTVKESAAGRLPGAQVARAHTLIECVQRVCARFPSSDERELEADGRVRLPAPFASAARQLVASRAYDGFHLVAGEGADRYAGARSRPDAPRLANLLDVPERVSSLSEAVAALVKCASVCEDLLARARDSSTSARLVLQMHLVALIGDLFTVTLPVPQPVGQAGGEACLWRDGWYDGQVAAAAAQRGSTLRDLQQLILQRVHHLTLLYGDAWQAVELPTRPAEAERCVVAAAMLAVFDAVARTMVPGQVLLLSEMLHEDGGYALSTGLCQSNRDLATVSATLELARPELCMPRDRVLAYFDALQAQCAQRLFRLEQPDGEIEVLKYGSTVMFFRRYLERCGYEWMPRDRMVPEMEALMNWMLSERTPLAQEHPEFGQLRDMVALFKFLATMETREAELLKRRRDPLENVPWRLSFDESGGMGGRYGWMRRGRRVHLVWEPQRFRGQDMTTADVHCTAFGDRLLRWGEGSVVQSPADVVKLLGVEAPTEDDVLHADRLPTFDDTLSREEGEMLFSYLTVSYVRVPLVLNFFASTDRVTYLFNPGLQGLLRAVLFETGAWCDERDRSRTIDMVPVRLTEAQRREAQADLERGVGAASAQLIRPFDQRVLGTSHGLLLNELCCSPEACLRPLMRMLHAIEDLTSSSVYSPDATFILYMVALAVDVETYAQHAAAMLRDSPAANATANLELLNGYRVQLREYLHGVVACTLEAWRVEAESRADMPTASVVHAYLALLWSNVDTELGGEQSLSEEAVVGILGNVAYVRNWHGFGLGQQRSHLILDANLTGLSSPEARLMRFLQAQGVDTRRVTKGSLDQYLSSSSRRRPLFLHIAGRTIRAPTLFKQQDQEAAADGDSVHRSRDDGDSDANDGKRARKQQLIPPANVPEHQLFALLQRHRRRLCAYLDRLQGGALDAVLNRVVRHAMRLREFAYVGWQAEGAGRFLAREAEIKFDAQTAESLWRGHAQKPVPDSMTQFPDFETLFGREAYHCGLVMRQEHRLWVHLIGTNYDLQEWDEPATDDQGVGVPHEPPPPPAERRVCTFFSCGKSLDVDCWLCAACTAHNDTPPTPGCKCNVCGSPRNAPDELAQRQRVRTMPTAMGQRGQQQEEENDEADVDDPFGGGLSRMLRRRRTQMQEPGPPKNQSKPVSCDRVLYNGVMYSRALDPYKPWPVQRERWATDPLSLLLSSIYRPPMDAMKWKLLLPEQKLRSDGRVVG